MRLARQLLAALPALLLPGALAALPGAASPPVAAAARAQAAGRRAVDGGSPAVRPAAAHSLGAPLAASLTTASATWALVPMGLLDQPDNTFWQLFVLSEGSSRWSLATPPGVADNGGLVGAPGTVGTLTVGFETSQLLGFSPLATTHDGGRSWVAAQPLPGPLAAWPDALAVSSGGTALALERAGGGSVYASASGLGAWRRLATTAALRSSAAGRACGVAALSAVAFAGSAPLLGASCARPGTVGLLEDGPRGWHLAGPPWPPGAGASTASVLRLDSGPFGLAALIALTPSAAASGREELVAARSAGGSGSWTMSTRLRLPAGAVLTSTGLGPAGSFVVTYRAASRLVAATEVARGAGWSTLPPLPGSTQAVALTPRGDVAVAVSRSVMTSYRLDPRPQRWLAGQRVTAPIEYGSSG